MMPINGETALCAWCGERIYFWTSGNRVPGKWLHSRQYPDGFMQEFGAHPDFCTEFRATPKAV